MKPTIQIKKHGCAGTIILNRPDKRNALSRNMLFEIRQALEDFHQEASVRAIILTGAGTAFCAGMDLREMEETAREDNPMQQWHEDATQYKSLIEYMLRYPRPIIAAVNGPAVAGGGGLVLAADITIATDTARFGFPEPRRGIVAGLVTPLLHFRIGGGHAARLLLTGELIEAAESHRLGIFHELVSEEVIWARANEIAEHCAGSAREAIQMTKRMIYETVGESLFTQLSVGAATSATARTTEAAGEGLQAFLEKREPKW